MNYTEKLLKFISDSPSPYHTVNTVKEVLLSNGYTELAENSSAYSDGGKHFVIRDGSSIIAFRGKGDGFMITAAHSDTPTFKLKSVDETVGAYSKLAVEPYGGMIYYSWLDRPLSVAGRVVVRTDDGVAVKLVNIDTDLMSIPSVAIHMNRTVNDGYKFNPAVDMLPLLSSVTDGAALRRLIAEKTKTAPEDIISQDLYLYNRTEGVTFGLSNEFILASRLDDLACVYSALEAFLAAPESLGAIPVLAVFNNEEVGSSTKQGANSTFLDNTLRRIAGTGEAYYSMLTCSYMVSADNAHAMHPNHPELSDTKNAPTLGGGVVIKYNANQRYTTDAVSDAVFRTLAARAGAKVQEYCNRADIPGGSTLGSISNTRVSVSTVDVGLPQLAMHSATETCAVSDLSDMITVLTELYSSRIDTNGDEIRIIK